MGSIRNDQEEVFNNCMKDFELDEDAFENGRWGKEQRIMLEPQNTPLPSLVFISLVVLKGFKYWGKSEKILWEIPIKYKSFPFLLSHRKFGFRLHCREGLDYPPGISDEMMVKLNEAIKTADNLIQPFVQKQVRSGNISVVNNYIKLEMMYRFFREKARSVFSRPPPKPRVTKKDQEGKPVAWGHDPDKREREGFYYSVAMLDAFFTRLEHLLVLVLPFIGFDPTKENLAAIMSANWTDKYRRLFDLTRDLKAKTLFEELKVIKEKYRNAIMHGYFEKGGASLFFHLPPYAVPVVLSGFEDTIHYSFFPITIQSYEDICSLLDEVDFFLKSGSAKYGVRFAESGLDVHFDSRSLSEYHSASVSEEAFEVFVERVGYLSDVSVNMDW